MGTLRTIRFIAGHPLNANNRVGAILRFVRWQIGSRLVSAPIVHTWVNGSRFFVRAGETGLTGNMYCGLHEFRDMGYLLHVVGESDLFVDIGANVGSYTILACAAKGARGYCFEPVPSTFQRLMDNMRLNDLVGRVKSFNLGLADKPGELAFTTGGDTVNHVVAAGETSEEVVRVPVKPLDEVLAGESPSMLKIDVEGFETPVIAGADATLRNPALHSVIMELNGAGTRYGYNETAIIDAMNGYGFSTYSYDPFSRELTSLGGKNSLEGNTLFIRDIEGVKKRIAEAPRITVGTMKL